MQGIHHQRHLETERRTLAPDAVPCPSELVTAEPFGEEIILFHLASKQYVLLHSFAAALWRAVDGTSTAARLSAGSGDAEAAAETLAGLYELGLLETRT